MSKENSTNDDLRLAVEAARDANLKRQQSKTWHEDQYRASVKLYSHILNGSGELEIELASTLEAFDIDGRYIPDPVSNVIERGNQALQEMVANGDIEASNIFCFFVTKTLHKSLTQDDIRRAESAAGIPTSL